MIHCNFQRTKFDLTILSAPYDSRDLIIDELVRKCACIFLRKFVCRSDFIKLKLKHSIPFVLLIGDKVERISIELKCSVSFVCLPIEVAHSVCLLFYQALMYTYYCKTICRFIGSSYYFFPQISRLFRLIFGINSIGTQIFISYMKITVQSRHIRQCKY